MADDIISLFDIQHYPLETVSSFRMQSSVDLIYKQKWPALEGKLAKSWNKVKIRRQNVVQFYKEVNYCSLHQRMLKSTSGIAVHKSILCNGINKIKWEMIGKNDKKCL